MAEKFTGGTWFYDNGAIENGSHVICTMNDIGDKVEANARLIAQGPAMYKALKDLLVGSELDPSKPNRVWSRACPTEEAIVKAFKVLAKIEGK